MNISLNPALEQLIHDKVASGLYNSVSEVIRDALRLLFEKDNLQKQRLEELNREIEKGLKCVEEGRLVDGATVRKRIKERSTRKRESI